MGLVHALCDHLQDWRRRGQDAPKIVCCITVTLNLSPTGLEAKGARCPQNCVLHYSHTQSLRYL